MLRADHDYFALDNDHLVVGTYRLGAKTIKGPLKLLWCFNGLFLLCIELFVVV